MPSWKVARERCRFWSTVAATCALFALALSWVNAPAAPLFAGVIAGAVGALGTSPSPRTPGWLQEFSLGVVGVMAGSLVDADVVSLVVSQPFTIVGSAVAILALTMAIGQLLRLNRNVGGSTAVFASIAGGASGVTAIARELHADEAVVVSIQYLRVLLVIATVPIVAPSVDGANAHSAASSPMPSNWQSYSFTAMALVVGLSSARLFGFTGSRLLFPLVAGMGLTMSGKFTPAQVPDPVLTAGFAGIGLMVGLELTRETLRRAARLMPLALLTITLGLACCALVGLALSHLAGVSLFTGYLATSPGGFSAVTAFAVDGGADVGLVVTCQTIRLLMAVLTATALGAIINRRAAG